MQRLAWAPRPGATGAAPGCATLGQRASDERFVEFAPARTMTGDLFYDALRRVPSVVRVAWARSRPSLGKHGNHYMDQDVLVYVD